MKTFQFSFIFLMKSLINKAAIKVTNKEVINKEFISFISKAVNIGKQGFGFAVLILLISFPSSRTYAQGVTTVPRGIFGSKQNPFGVSYFSFSNVGRPGLAKGSPSWRMEQYVAFNYDSSPTQRWSFRVPFSSKTKGFNERGTWVDEPTVLTDLYMTFADRELYRWNMDTKVSSTFYAYYPSTIKAREDGWALRLKAWTIFEHMVDPKWTLSYHFKPDYFFQRETRINTYKIGQLEHYMEVSYSANKYWRPIMDLGFYHEWNYVDDKVTSITDKIGPGRNVKKLNENYKLALGTWFYPLPGLKFIFAIENKLNLDRSTEEQGVNIFTFIDFL